MDDIVKQYLQSIARWLIEDLGADDTSKETDRRYHLWEKMTEAQRRQTNELARIFDPWL